MAGILAAYGISAGEDRPDVVVSEAATGVVVAIGEAKFFINETDSWRSALRDAAIQLVRYGRGYAPGSALDALLTRSVIGLWKYPAAERPGSMPTTAPMVADFSDLQNGSMTEWAARITTNVPALHSAA